MFRAEKMGAQDFPFAVQLANTMDWNMAQEDFQFMKKLEPNGCFVLHDGSKRIGIATCISFGKIGWFGNLVVREDCRKKGAGSLLVKHAVDYLQKRDVETIGLYAYENLMGFYENLSFKPDVTFSVLKGKNVRCLAQATFKEINEKDVPAVVEFDRGCFGDNRRKLLELIITNKNNLCYFSANDKETLGYVAAKVYDEVAEIGPLVCRENNVDVAVSLLKTTLCKLGKREASICLPAAERALLETLSEAGFDLDFHVTRMFLGRAAAKSCIYVAESLERG